MKIQLPRPMPNNIKQTANRKALLAQMTEAQQKACERAYRQHLVTCASYRIPASEFGVFAIEWLECEAGEEKVPTVQANGDGRDDGYQQRSYERMYEGKRGWE